MYLSRFGRAPKSWLRAAACPSVLVIAALGAGCSSTRQAQFAYPGDPHLRPQAAQVQPASMRKPAVEDDGMEAQPEPPRRQMVEPDDPTEPFSPNYGNRPGDPPQRRPVMQPPRRIPLPPGAGPRTKVADAAPVRDDVPPYFQQKVVSADVD